MTGNGGAVDEQHGPDGLLEGSVGQRKVWGSRGQRPGGPRGWNGLGFKDWGNRERRQGVRRIRGKGVNSVSEGWRRMPQAQEDLGPQATDELFRHLDASFKVHPRQVGVNGQLKGSPSSSPGTPTNSEMPVLEIKPLELFRHILACFAASVWTHDDTSEAEWEEFVEIFGGTAQAVCHADADARLQRGHHCSWGSEDEQPVPLSMDGAAHRPPQPTDLDARFYIPEGEGFDFCRSVVEEYLHMKLMQTLPKESPLRKQVASASQLRYVYFQKQTVVGDVFSILSVGDPSTGKNIDMEFAYMGNGVRKYFDLANAAVIPLTLTQLGTAGQLTAMSQYGDYHAMCDAMLSRELYIQAPEEVVNGLALYCHAICDKGQRPVDADAEDEYGSAFCEGFVSQCQQLIDAGQEPTRFIRSFIRSHYPTKPVKAVGAVVQMLVELSAYAPAVKDWEMSAYLCERLANLLCETITAAFNSSSHPGSKDNAAILGLLAFLAMPGPGSNDDDATSTISSEDVESSSSESSEGSVSTRPIERIRKIRAADGQECYMLAKAFSVNTWAVCGQMIDRIHDVLQFEEEMAGWKRTLWEAAYELLELQCNGANSVELPECLDGVLNFLEQKGQLELACTLLTTGFSGKMKCSDVKSHACKLLEVCPLEMVDSVGKALVRNSEKGKERHQSARTAIRILQNRKADLVGDSRITQSVDKSILKLLMSIPCNNKPQKDRLKASNSSMDLSQQIGEHRGVGTLPRNKSMESISDWRAALVAGTCT